MKKKLKTIVNIILTTKSSQEGTRLITFLYCLGIAFLFWLLIVFSKEYKAPITFNLKYTHFPEDKMLANKPLSKIDIEVSASGFTFLGFYLKKIKDTLLIDASNIHKYNNPKEYYLPIVNQYSNFENQLDNRVKISKVLIDTLHFYFDKKVVKIIPVHLNISYSFDRQFQQMGNIEVLPSKIVVSGPESVMTNITELNTQQLNFLNLKKTLSTSAEIILTEEMRSVELSSKKVLVKIPVEKFTEGTMEIPVEVMNVPSQFLIKTFPSKVKISYLVGLSNYEKVKADQFSLMAYFKDQDLGSSSLRLKLAKYPGFIRSPKIETSKVEYILRKK